MQSHQGYNIQSHNPKSKQKFNSLPFRSIAIGGSKMFNLQTIFIVGLAFLITTNAHAEALTAASDISALRAIKASINPSSIPPWSCLASWNFTTDPCASPRRIHFICGVLCSPDSTRVTEITLDPIGYSGTLTPLISQLTQLITLDLSGNSLYGAIPSSIDSLSKLQTLNLHSNYFSGSVPPSITNLKSLETIDLSYNSLSGTIPNPMNALSNLKRLDLSYNNLTGSLPRLPPNLIELAVKHNSLFGSLDKSSFDGLNQLAVLELSENSLTGPIDSWFFVLRSLQQVNLANNSFTHVDVSMPVGGDSNLVAVDLGFNKIEGYAPVNFAAYPMMSSLTLRHNKLRGLIPMQYGKHRSLRRLFLDGNFFTGNPPAAFFTGTKNETISGSFGDNCLQSCPRSSNLCITAQKPSSVCRPMS